MSVAAVIDSSPMPPLRTLLVHLTRTSATHHRLAIERDDGSREVCDLETRSCLRHDLVHFAVETEARLGDAFFGRLARGVPYAALAGPARPIAGTDELMQTERVVGSLQSAVGDGLDAAAFVTRMRDYAESMGDGLPGWLTEDLIRRVVEALRRLEGRWRATAFGDTMTLRFCLPEARG